MGNTVDGNFKLFESRVHPELVRILGGQGRDVVLQRRKVSPTEEPALWGLEAGLDQLAEDAPCRQVLHVPCVQGGSLILPRR